MTKLVDNSTERAAACLGTPLRLALVGLVLVVATACHSRPDLNVVLISMDTTRADHLGCYGAEGTLTPNIDALAARSLRFEWAFSAVPVTLPSHTTVLSGLYPPRHSVRDNGTFTVPDELPTLATVLADRGWTTIGVIGAYPLTARFGLSRGFAVWDEKLGDRSGELLPLAFDQRSADQVTRAALRQLERHASEPVFLFVHYFDPHRPWEAPALYARRYRQDPYSAEIAFTDAWIGELLRGIEDLGLEDRTAVILLADHGEGLSEHEEETHSYLVYNGTTRVPLMVSAPGLQPGVVSSPVSLADVAPTVLELVGVEGPPMDGRSLLQPPDPERLIYIEALAGRLQHGWNDMRAAVVGGHKVILGPEPELYDYSSDPGERLNRSSERPNEVAALRQRLLERIESASGELSLADRFSRPDEEVALHLEALGYVVAEEDPSDLQELGVIVAGNEPRHHLDLVEVQSLTRGLINSRRIDLALEILARAKTDHPEDLALARLEVITHALAGHQELAVELARGLGARPEATGADHQIVAGVLWRAGAVDEALVEASAARVLDPKGNGALIEADILAGSGRSDEAVSRLQVILDDEPCHRAVLVALAAIHRDRGELDRARDRYESLLHCDPDDVPAMVNLGNVAFEFGDPATAEARFRQALDLDPGSNHARYGLALMALERGQRDEAVPHLRAVVAREPLSSPLGRRAAELLGSMGETDGLDW